MKKRGKYINFNFLIWEEILEIIFDMLKTLSDIARVLQVLCCLFFCQNFFCKSSA